MAGTSRPRSPQAGRGEERVADGVEHHVAIRMAVQARRVRRLTPPELQAQLRAEPVDVLAEADRGSDAAAVAARRWPATMSRSAG